MMALAAPSSELQVWVAGVLNGKGAAPGSSVVATPSDPCCPHGLTERYVICPEPAICNRGSPK